MSSGAKFSRIPAWAAALELTETDWRVLHAIGLHADKSGHAYPSLARIGKIARVRRNHVSRSTKRMEHLGLLRLTRLSRGSGWANTHYDIVFDPPDWVAPAMVAPDVAPGMAAPDTEVAPRMVAGGTPSGSTDGTSSGALTYQLTDHRTDLTRKEVDREESVSGAVVPSAGSTLAERANGQTCRWYVTNDHGFRICNQPADASGYCGEHPPRAEPDLPGK
jgi:hypothetical protein